MKINEKISKKKIQSFYFSCYGGESYMLSPPAPDIERRMPSLKGHPSPAFIRTHRSETPISWWMKSDGDRRGRRLLHLSLRLIPV